MGGVEIRAEDERGQITYSSGPFRGSEAYRDACRSALTTPRLLTGATVRRTLPSSPSCSLYLSPFLFLSLRLRRLCFATFSSVCFIVGPHLPGLGAFLHVQSLSLIANLPRLSAPFYAQVFFFPLSVVGMLLFFHSCS